MFLSLLFKNEKKLLNRWTHFLLQITDLVQVWQGFLPYFRGFPSSAIIKRPFLKNHIWSKIVQIWAG